MTIHPPLISHLDPTGLHERLCHFCKAKPGIDIEAKHQTCGGNLDVGDARYKFSVRYKCNDKAGFRYVPMAIVKDEFVV